MSRPGGDRYRPHRRIRTPPGSGLRGRLLPGDPDRGGRAVGAAGLDRRHGARQAVDTPVVRRRRHVSRARHVPLGPGHEAAVERPGAGGVPGRDRREPLAARAGGRCSRSRSGVGAAVFLEEFAPPGPDPPDRSRRTSPTSRGCRRSSTASSGWRSSSGPSALEGLALGPSLWAGGADLEPAGPAGDRHRHPGGAPDRAELAPPGRARPGGDPLADGPRPRPALGLARHPDRDDPRPLAGHRRDRPAADGRRGRLDPPAAPRALRPLHRPAGRDLQLRQGAEHRVPDRGRRRHPDPPDPPADDERRGHRDPEPLHGRSARG